MKKMLVVVAHPSDESFVFGGMIGLYKDAGWDIRLICATYGEQAPELGLQGEVIGESVEQKELKLAAKILGISNTNFLGYKTGRVSAIPPGTLEATLENTMRDMLPDIVVTFGVNGINNDPDHIKICYATTYAFQKYARHLHILSQPELVKGRGKEWKQFEFQRAFGETGEFEKNPKLYYACYPTSITEYLQKIKSLPIESFGKRWVGTVDKNITTVIDIKDKSKKIKALSAYESYREEIDPFISFEKNPYLEREYYLLRMQGIYEVYMSKNDRVSEQL
jgi:LmbE family N-acetylglucosaminyl deacetylase